jgi:tRNA-binding EMAP/Myf-like protein
MRRRNILSKWNALSEIYLPAPGEDPIIDAKEGEGKTPCENRKLKNEKTQRNKSAKDNSSNKKAPAAVVVDRDLPDICKLEFKVGLITKVWIHPDADKLYCEEIDCGEAGGPRQIASGLRKHYGEEDMLGKRVLVVANLKVRAWYQTLSSLKKGIFTFHFVFPDHPAHEETFAVMLRRKIL